MIFDIKVRPPTFPRNNAIHKSIRTIPFQRYYLTDNIDTIDKAYPCYLLVYLTPELKSALQKMPVCSQVPMDQMLYLVVPTRLVRHTIFLKSKRTTIVHALSTIEHIAAAQYYYVPAYLGVDWAHSGMSDLAGHTFPTVYIKTPGQPLMDLCLKCSNIMAFHSGECQPGSFKCYKNRDIRLCTIPTPVTP
jgi:hypothetical protein